ncbi:MAG: acyltransferase [Acidobacteria bacterium]|nr:acyltransferase [Acidobacteriota bacterium]
MTASKRIALVDQVRGLAALSVAWFHATNGYRDTVSRLGSYGWLGVEAFFVISGFVIPLALDGYPQGNRWRDSLDFIARRLVRLEPAYVASIAMVIALNVLASQFPAFRGGDLHYSVPQLLVHLFYLVPLTRYEWVQVVYWTLAYEFAFYVAMALLFPLSLREKKWATRLCMLATLSLVALGRISHLVALFVMGLAAFTAATERDSRWASRVAIVAAAVAMLYRGAHAEALVGIVTAVALAEHRRIGSLRGRAGAALLWLGSVSYSLYLVHVPVGGKIVNLGRRFVRGEAGEFALSLVALTVCVVVAWTFAAVFERPIVNLARRIRVSALPQAPVLDRA